MDPTLKLDTRKKANLSEDIVKMWLLPQTTKKLVAAAQRQRCLLAAVARQAAGSRATQSLKRAEQQRRPDAASAREGYTENG